MTDKNDNTVTAAPKLQKKKVGRPFAKGQDARRNIKGRPSVPKSQVELNALIDELLSETSTVKENGRDVAMSKARILLNKLILSKSPVGQIHILDRRFGKVTDKVEHTGADGGPIEYKGYTITANPAQWDDDKKDANG